MYAKSDRLMRVAVLHTAKPERFGELDEFKAPTAASDLDVNRPVQTEAGSTGKGLDRPDHRPALVQVRPPEAEAYSVGRRWSFSPTVASEPHCRLVSPLLDPSILL